MRRRNDIYFSGVASGKVAMLLCIAPKFHVSNPSEIQRDSKTILKIKNRGHESRRGLAGRREGSEQELGGEEVRDMIKTQYMHVQ
jgi:hypothetical protein